jgi:hypothetical protein
MNRNTASSDRLIRAVAVIGLCSLSLPLASLAQSSRGSDPARTAWGEPDLSGVYAQYSTAPLERPQNFGEREFLTDEEFAELERRRLAPLDLRPAESDTEPGTAADVHYNLAFYLIPVHGTSSNR